MFVLVTYDVSVLTREGRSRLRRIAKTCLDFGVRVQNSVFECDIEPDKWVRLKHDLLAIMEPNEDSLRFYFLGSRGWEKIEHVGAKMVANPLRDPLIL